MASITLLRKLLAEERQKNILLTIRNEYLEFPQEQRKQAKQKLEVGPLGQLLYFIRADTSIKIGLTATGTKKRKKDLQCGNHRPLRTILEVEGANGDWERAFHALVAPWHVDGTGTEWFDFGQLVDCFIGKITEKSRDIGELLKVVEVFVAGHRPEHLTNLQDVQQRQEEEARQKEAAKIQRKKDQQAAKEKRQQERAVLLAQQQKDRGVVPFSVAHGEVPKIAHWQLVPLADTANEAYNWLAAAARLPAVNVPTQANALERDALGKFKRAL